MQESSAIPLTTSLAPPTFSELLADTQRPLYAFVAGLVGDTELARDIVQDVFCDAWRALRRGSPPFGAPLDGAAARWVEHQLVCRRALARRALHSVRASPQLKRPQPANPWTRMDGRIERGFGWSR